MQKKTVKENFYMVVIFLYFTKLTRKKKYAPHIGYEPLSNTTGILLRNLLYNETDNKINNKKVYILLSKLTCRNYCP